MNYHKSLRSLIGAAAVLGAATLPTQAYAEFLDFTIDETPFSADGLTFVADKLNGGYREVITFTPIDATTSTFETHAIADFGQFFANEGTQLILGSQVNQDYGLYALFTSSGTVDTSGANTVFTGGAGSFQLFLDDDLDTTKSLGVAGGDSPTVGNDADDILIGFSSVLQQGTGTLIAGIGGFFDLIFDEFTLTSGAGLNGDDFFISPTNFYTRTTVDGDFDDFVVAGTQTITGDVSAVFVPEPSTIALFGLALTGLGLSMRRKEA